MPDFDNKKRDRERACRTGKEYLAGPNPLPGFLRV
jgi:hypothetical protein